MKYEFHRTGTERKPLVAAIAEITGTEAKYLRVPTCNYQIGDIIVDKEGTVEIPANIFPKDVVDLLQKLADRGFVPAGEPMVEEAEETAKESEEMPESENVALTVAIPLEQVKVGNLTNLLDAKGYLIKKALGITDIRITVDGEKVSFPWFSEMPDAEEIKAYQNFIAALCKMSREQKRINSTEKKAENEKYAFRCFLLRLGFIGDDYKQDRKILLKNLSGSSAFKTGEKKTYRVELDDDNFKTFKAKDDLEAQIIGDQIAEECGSEFCDVMEEEA